MPFDAQGWLTTAINYDTKTWRSGAFARGNAGRKAVVLHITDGTNSLSTLGSATSRVSSHFLNREEGIYQHVSIHDTHYANGLSYKDGRWIDPAGNIVDPPWQGLTPPTNPNYTTVSIENEGRPNKPLSPRQQQQLTALLRDLADVYPQFRPYVPHQNLIGHCEIGPKHRANCPGPLFHFESIAAAANAPRILVPAPPRVIIKYRVKHGIDGGYAQIRQGPGVGFPEASTAGVSARLRSGDIVETDAINGDWLHLASGLGFVAGHLLEAPVGNVGLAFISPPRISKATFVKILRTANSPALPEAEAMYDGCAAVGVDPALLLAFFQHESTYGKFGICKTHDTKNPGNVRKAYNVARGHQLQIEGRGPFWKFDSWTQGAIDWAERMKFVYVRQKNLDTVDKAIPVYAPSSDSNAPERYIEAVTNAVKAWQAMEATQ